MPGLLNFSHFPDGGSSKPLCQSSVRSEMSCRVSGALFAETVCTAAAVDGTWAIIERKGSEKTMQASEKRK
jgi:hypothetical protein